MTQFPQSHRPPFIGTSSVTLLILATVAAVYAFDVFLFRLERAELAAEARSFFAQAQGCAGAGRKADAVELYRRAAALDRTNRNYQIAFARALIASGRFDQARQVIADRVQQEALTPGDKLRDMRAHAAQLYLDLALGALAQCPSASSSLTADVPAGAVISADLPEEGSGAKSLATAERIWGVVRHACPELAR